MHAASRFAWMVLPVIAAATCNVAAAQTVSHPAQTSGLPTQQPTDAARTSTHSTVHRPEVRYIDGLLTVTAHDSSLNAILHEIATLTGMKISGGVRDDRVFGTYGPDQPSAVLSTLLDGSGSNMLLVNNTANQPQELILTTRVGGPTPPSEFAAAHRQSQEQDSDESTPVQMGPGPQGPPPGIRVGDGPRLQSNAQPASLNPPISTPVTNNSDSQAVVFPPVNATTTPATATTSSDVTQETPEGVKTPQQIFEQLQRMRQQQEQTQPQDSSSPQ